MKDNRFVITLFLLLNKECIEYSVLRNYQFLPQHTGGSDIDLWISSKDVSRLYAILEKVRNEVGSNLVSYLTDVHCPKVCYLSTEEGCQIDIFKGCINYQNNAMITEQSIKENITYYKNIKILDDCFANVIAFLKEIINNGRCDNKYIMPLYANKNVYQKEYLQTKFPLFSSFFIEELYNAIQKENIPQQIPVLYQLAKKSIVKSCLSFYRFRKIKRVFQKPGYVIAVLGTDGSGKSTVINAITPIVNEAFHKSVVYNHLRPNVIPDIAVLMGKRKKAEKEEVVVVSDPHAGKQSGFAGSLVRWGYYMIDYIFGYLKKVWPAIHTKSKVFIFDRYYYEYYFDQKRSHTSLPQWILRVGEWFLPRPDLILCLGGDPKKIYERKPETSLEEVTRQTKVLKDFCAKRKNAVWIDTTIAPEESVRCAMDAICDMMSKRFANVKLK